MKYFKKTFFFISIVILGFSLIAIKKDMYVIINNRNDIIELIVSHKKNYYSLIEIDTITSHLFNPISFILITRKRQKSDYINIDDFQIYTKHDILYIKDLKNENFSSQYSYAKQKIDTTISDIKLNNCFSVIISKSNIPYKQFIFSIDEKLIIGKKKYLISTNEFKSYYSIINISKKSFLWKYKIL